MVKLIIGGDFVPTPSNFEAFQSGHIEEVIDAEILQKFSAADFRIFNLECPLCDELSPIEKYGPHLQAPTSCIKGIKALNPTMLCLANNHIMDHGARGLASTLTLLEQNQIKYSGAGNLEQAASPYIIEKNGLKIGVHCCAENEFSIVSESYPGANPFNSLETPDYVAEIKKNCDFVVVLYHGGREHYRYPSPELQKKCRKLAEKGADIIICQHSHCIGCRENYKGSEIVYGQGNFLFDFSEEEARQTGLLCNIEFSGGGFSCNYIPIRKKGAGVVYAQEQDAAEILKSFLSRSEEIKNHNFVKDNYKKEAARAFPIYLSAFQRGERYAMQNYIDCEAHHEIFAEALKSAPLPTNNKPAAKFFGKVKCPNGKRKIYCFGIKIFSYTRRLFK